MGKETERSSEMRRVLDQWESSGIGRREFCQQRGIALTTFDYWRRAHATKRRKPARLPRMVAVKVTMRSEELAMLVNGLDVKQTRQRNWYGQRA